MTAGVYMDRLQICIGVDNRDVHVGIDIYICIGVDKVIYYYHKTIEKHNDDEQN